MYYFKITRIWTVKAMSEQDAFRLVDNSPNAYLESETVSRTVYKKPQQQTGWGNTVKHQLLGLHNKR
jgi:hypothetical protein